LGTKGGGSFHPKKKIRPGKNKKQEQGKKTRKLKDAINGDNTIKRGPGACGTPFGWFKV